MAHLVSRFSKHSSMKSFGHRCNMRVSTCLFHICVQAVILLCPASASLPADAVSLMRRELGGKGFAIGSVHQESSGHSSGPSPLHSRVSHHNASGNEESLRNTLCTMSEAFVIGSLYHELSGDRSHCPGDDILFDLRDAYFEYGDDTRDVSARLLAETSTRLGEAVFVDIGFNKGYNYASWMAVFNPEVGITPKAWHESMRKTKISVDQPCGACDDCGASTLYQATKSTKQTTRFKSTMLGIDLNSENIDLVQAIISNINVATSELEKHIYLNLTHSGASRSEGFIGSDLQCQGSREKCSLSNSKVSSSGSIPVTTLDSLFESYIATKQIRPRFLGPLVKYRPYVDVLMIDTEGNDAEILSCANKILSERMARLVVFEYHGFCPWPKTPLIKVINMFRVKNYACYFPGQEKRMWRITGCFTELFDYHMWSNIYCVYRHDPWYDLFESRRVLPKDALQRLEKMGKDKIKLREFPKKECK